MDIFINTNVDMNININFPEKEVLKPIELFVYINRGQSVIVGKYRKESRKGLLYNFQKIKYNKKHNIIQK